MVSERRFSNPTSMSAPLGPYSQVVGVGDLAFVSGQVGMRPDGELAGPGIIEQTRQALENVALALEGVGMTLDHVVKVTLFVVHPEDLDELVPYMDEEFPQHFTAGLPASTLVFVDRLFDPALRIEVEVVAHR